MRVAGVAFLASLTLALGACGGSDVAAGPASSAGVLKAGAVVYWQTVSDPDSEQWKQADDLLQRFPDGDRWVAELKKELEEEGVSWETDVKPALGSVVDVAVYASSGAGPPSVVVLTNPEAKDKLRELVRKFNLKSDEDAVTRVVGDWVAISTNEAAFDAALKAEGGQSLADEEAFKSAMDELPDDALSRVYANPATAAALAPAGMERKALDMFGLGKLEFAGAWAKAKDEGAELAAVLRGEGADRLLGTGETYSSKLLDQVPDDAFAFVTFQGGGLRGQLDGLRQNPLFAMGLRDFEQESGVDVDEIAALLDGEIAFYVRPAASPVPEFTLLLDAPKPAEARASVERILRLAADHLGGVVTEDGDITTARFGGFTVNVGSRESVVVVTTSKDAFTARDAAGDKLPDSERYKSALEAAGAPDEYTGLAYVDVTKTWELVRSYLGFSGDDEQVPPSVSRNLEPLKSFVAYGTKDGSLSTSLAFVEIE
jgi:Protein of unknown function (DUF3352)